MNYWINLRVFGEAYGYLDSKVRAQVLPSLLKSLFSSPEQQGQCLGSGFVAPRLLSVILPFFFKKIQGFCCYFQEWYKSLMIDLLLDCRGGRWTTAARRKERRFEGFQLNFVASILVSSSLYLFSFIFNVQLYCQGLHFLQYELNFYFFGW